MKTSKYLFSLIASLGLLCGAQSCKQDLGQNPPFDYPTEKPAEDDDDNLPEALYHLALDGDLQVEGSLAGSLALYDQSASPLFETGAVGQAYRNADGQALVLTPDAASMNTLAALRSFTVSMWIHFDGSNGGSTALFNVGNSADAIGNLSLFLNNGNAADPGSFYFKGYFNNATGTTWFDLGGDTTITGMADSWQQVGLSFDAETSTMTLWHNGLVKSSYTWDGGMSIGFKNLTGIVLGAFPVQVGMGATGDWTESADFYTGAFDDVYLFDKALSVEEMTALYNKAEK